MREREVARVVRRLLRLRGAGKTICPSEIARALTAATDDPSGWRAHMTAVRAVVARMADRGAVVVMQRGRVVNARSARGPIRVAHADDARPRGRGVSSSA